MSRKARVPGMAATQSFVIPRCSVHDTPMQKDDVGNFVCMTCADDWLQQFLLGRSQGGVVLPSGVKDSRASFRDLMPNRRFRRHALKRPRGVKLG